MSRRTLSLGLAAAVAVGAVLAGKRRLASRTARLTADLSAASGDTSPRVVAEDDYAALPDPVRRYFETVLDPGTPYVRTARLTQRGAFRLGDVDSAWHPFDATQTYAVDPPGFVWDATVRLGSVVPVNVVDSYVDGTGSLAAHLLWTVPVAEADPSPKLDAGELQRYLAEAVWFPTALLPESGVEWMPVDDSTARATLTDGDMSASLAFHFDEDSLVDKVVADQRYRAVDDGYEAARWTGRFEDYAERGGMVVPTRGEVAWNLSQGDLPYWRGEITGFEFETAG
ncbi:hypothetical protein EGH21_16440 [Halomicroarcula sp. F13]|uniref:Uncharacterized protein n=1 Tax=Haloarcula rubra TaxID=2487747 RepID=A0AAW4PUC1_9EURY|nr:DUF6544 family protein [Halomicroarcula rubra]MBX0324618.1 hypothetical protein [Halomicroarcula rubra]